MRIIFYKVLKIFCKCGYENRTPKLHQSKFLECHISEYCYSTGYLNLMLVSILYLNTLFKNEILLLNIMFLYYNILK